MVGQLWSTGISLYCNGEDEWWASVKVHDNGFCDLSSICGEIKTCYGQPLSDAIDIVKRDTENLGIIFPNESYSRHLYYIGDGEWKDYPPPEGWKELLQQEAKRIGWKTYK